MFYPALWFCSNQRSAIQRNKCSPDMVAPVTTRLLAPAAIISVWFSFMPHCAASDLSGQSAIIAKSQATKDSKASLQMLEAYIAAHPDAAEAYFQAARMSNATKNNSKTVALATKYLALKPAPIDYYIYHLRAHAYSGLGQFNRALSDLDIARKAQPKDSEVLLLAGLAHQQLGQYKEALQEFSLAAKLNEPRAIRCKAEIELDKHQVEAAAADYVEFARKQPDGLGVILAKLLELSRSGKCDSALYVLNELLNANLPKTEERLLDLKANILYENNRKKEALEVCDLFEKKFKKTDLYTIRYGIVWEKKDYESALVCLNGMLKSRPSERALYLMRGDCYRALDEYEKALADYNRVPDLVMKDVQKRKERAECNYQLGHFSEAAKEFDAVNSIQPTGEGYERQGRCLLALQRYKEALVCLSRAVRLTPLKADFVAARGDCYRRLHEYTHALKDFSDAMVLKPDNMIYVFGRGLCLAELGRNAEAIKDFTAAMSNPHLLSRACLERARAYDKIGEKTKAEADRKAAQSASKSVEDDFFR